MQVGDGGRHREGEEGTESGEVTSAGSGHGLDRRGESTCVEDKPRGFMAYRNSGALLLRLRKEFLMSHLRADQHSELGENSALESA